MNFQSSPAGFLSTELGKRIISAIVMVLIILTICWIGGWPFIVLATLLSLLLYYEWQSVVRQTAFDAAEALLSLGFVGLLIANIFGYLGYGLAGFLALGLVLEVASVGQEKSDVRWIGLGALYCAVPAIAFPLIRDSGGFALIMFLFIIVWITDIAAYFAGRKFGGAKLMPAVSPKKTWSGALGGLVCSVIAATLFAQFFLNFGVVLTLVLAVALSVVSQIGDLFESWVKRLFDVKDSSQLIPGHGGFLDRMDGLIAASVPMAVMVALSIG